jgi:hypothetical protein
VIPPHVLPTKTGNAIRQHVRLIKREKPRLAARQLPDVREHAIQKQQRGISKLFPEDYFLSGS